MPAPSAVTTCSMLPGDSSAAKRFVLQHQFSLWGWADADFDLGKPLLQLVHTLLGHLLVPRAFSSFRLDSA
jgi:hypothetical protein